ncbi:FecR family protein, partial [Gloeocapsopsis sp. IPPAS B-1203]|uniref:FecR family protein n=1 Tax=Gloeocapsopsis sp. IPPAS B-1203 TaxID=2049454 RepID=UPI000C19108A
MSRKFVLILTFVFWSMTLPIAKKASAETTLTRAVVQNIRNLVRLLPQNRTPRPARLSDAIQPGDALSTGRSSLAELRFNDGSLARVGEQAVFRFIAKTRRFRLSNGTVLLLIPPGRGVTGIQTPNAAAAIRGSALFVRYIPDTDTTIVGALTDSNIEVFNQTASQSEVLEAGQMAVVVNDRIEQLFEFDLNTFYETSDLVQQLNLNRPNTNPSADPALSSVQAETAAAAASKQPVRGEGVVENPSFVQSPSNSARDTQQTQGNNTSTTPSPTESTPSSTTNPTNGGSNNQPPDNAVRDGTTPVGNTTPPSSSIDDAEPVTPPLENDTPTTGGTSNNTQSPTTPPTTEDNTPPTTEETPTTPPTEPVDNTPIEPPVDNTPTEPTEPIDNTPTEPVDNTPIEPPVDNTPTEPPVDNTPTEPPVDNTPTEPPVDNTPTEPTEPIDNTPTEPVDNTPIEPPVDNTPIEPPVDNTPT